MAPEAELYDYRVFGKEGELRYVVHVLFLLLLFAFSPCRKVLFLILGVCATSTFC